LSRTLARRGHRVIAIDCDSDPNLAANSGAGERAADAMRAILDQSGPKRHLPQGLTPAEMLRAYGLAGPDEVTLLLAARSEKAGSG
ncbi:MAG: hypothetical protein ACRDZW_02840, partial [Acidimicrobiales bacterium]